MHEIRNKIDFLALIVSMQYKVTQLLCLFPDCRKIVSANLIKIIILIIMLLQIL